MPPPGRERRSARLLRGYDDGYESYGGADEEDTELEAWLRRDAV